MEKIIIFSRDAEVNKSLVALTSLLFAECEIQVHPAGVCREEEGYGIRTEDLGDLIHFERVLLL